jgi:hypothetical protein
MLRLSILICLFSLFGCKTQTFSPDKPSLEYIKYGTTGGFANQQDFYYLFSNGQRHHTIKVGETRVELPKIKASEAKELIEEATKIVKAHEDFLFPYNLSYHLEWHKGDQTTQVIWGDYLKPPPADIQKFYDMLMALPAQ